MHVWLLCEGAAGATPSNHTPLPKDSGALAGGRPLALEVPEIGTGLCLPSRGRHKS